MKPRRTLTRAEWLLFGIPLLAVVLLFGVRSAALLPIFNCRAIDARNICQSNLRQIGLAFASYAQDYDALPLTLSDGPRSTSVTATVGWADGIQPYIKCTTCLYCYGDPNWRQTTPRNTGYVYYWMNANLSGVPRSRIASPTLTLLLGDGDDGTDQTDATYSETALPPAWLNDTNSPAYRHLGGANYLFADGTVHWLRPGQVTTFGGRRDAFAVR